MRNTVGMKGVVYGVNNPSLSTVYEVDSFRGGGELFLRKISVVQKFNGENCIIDAAYPCQLYSSEHARSRRKNRFLQSWIDTAWIRLYSNETRSILQTVINFFSLEG